MSYIRSTSNDEHLYVFCNMNEIVEFHKGENYVGKMPVDIFNMLIDIWIENGQEDAEFHDATIIDTFIGGEPFIRLEYEHKWHLDMQFVTWYYIARSNYGRSKPFWRTRLMRRLFGNWVY